MTVWQRILGSLAGVEIIMLLGMSLAASRFGEMYANMGAELPTLTRLATNAWFPPVLALFPLAGILASGAVHPDRQKLALIAGFTTGALAIALCLWAWYAPIFAVSGQIR